MNFKSYLMFWLSLVFFGVNDDLFIVIVTVK